jgi:hydroxymethylglutaryl-CoA reductase
MINGFSKFSKKEKINWLIENYFHGDFGNKDIIEKYLNSDNIIQKLHDELSENTISNFYLPLGIAPNFLINNKDFVIPMAIEESSVVAAACKSAKFWYSRGGFKTEVIKFKKTGQVHFKFYGNESSLEAFFKSIKDKLIGECSDITENMNKRGGGITAINLNNESSAVNNYYQINVEFNTVDSMGANFINSCLEKISQTFENEFKNYNGFSKDDQLEIIMSILSNHTPECLVRAEVSCKIKDLESKEITNSKLFVNKFIAAIEIAENNISRAVTHNKGIMNGIDSVVIATGNDFRAVEASAHSYASLTGKYTSLSHAKIVDDQFTFWMELPFSIGTVGGITNIHPLVKWCLQLLGNPSAKELMGIIAASGLAQNFAAVKSLVTEGIQAGHMKMHLNNILNSLNASSLEKQKITQILNSSDISYSLVDQTLQNLRKK